jgi:hypothetical protein
MTPVFGDDRADGRHVPDLMTQRFRVVAMQGMLAITADRRFAIVEGVGLIDEGTLGLGVSVLTARFFARRRLGRRAFEGRRIGGRWLRGIGGILLEPRFEVSEALLIVLCLSGESRP